MTACCCQCRRCTAVAGRGLIFLSKLCKWLRLCEWLSLTSSATNMAMAVIDNNINAGLYTVKKMWKLLSTTARRSSWKSTRRRQQHLHWRLCYSSCSRHSLSFTPSSLKQKMSSITNAIINRSSSQALVKSIPACCVRTA
jgi:hypothetical protein